MSENISVRLLQEGDLPAADYIMRLAFGTFVGLPDPTTFMGDASYVQTRWIAEPQAAFAAEIDGELVGSNFATNWGSVGFFGPLAVHPKFWDRKAGRQLMEPVVELFDRWGTQQAGLFTFPHSPKHVGFYQKFGFWPRFLTAIMAKPVECASLHPEALRFSEIPANEREAVLKACRELTDAIYAGLDVTREIRAVESQALGDTILLWEKGRLAGLAVCHMGAGTEAGSGTCYVKFAAIHPGAKGEAQFGCLLDACEAVAASRGLSQMVAGVNTARHEAYRQMLARGFRTDRQGVAMTRSSDAGYNRPGVWVLDDWR